MHLHINCHSPDYSGQKFRWVCHRAHSFRVMSVLVCKKKRFYRKWSQWSHCLLLAYWSVNLFLTLFVLLFWTSIWSDFFIVYFHLKGWTDFAWRIVNFWTFWTLSSWQHENSIDDSDGILHLLALCRWRHFVIISLGIYSLFTVYLVIIQLQKWQIMNKKRCSWWRRPRRSWVRRNLSLGHFLGEYNDLFIIFLYLQNVPFVNASCNYCYNAF